ncbi:MAG: hypothetical protein LUI01_08785 [Firmicutes bacterium]|nr:hypothetical protein [Bacillota bacterium]
MARADEKKRTALYIAPSVWGDFVDINYAEAACRDYVRADETLRLTRIYRDTRAAVRRVPDIRERNAWIAEDNEAWKRLLDDAETGAIEAVVIYAAGTVAPTIFALQNAVNEFFIPCGIRFADVQTGFDTGNVRYADASSAAEGRYFKQRRSEYRSFLMRRAYNIQENEKSSDVCDVTPQNGEERG